MVWVRVAVMVPNPGSTPKQRQDAHGHGDDAKKTHPPKASYFQTVVGGDGYTYGLCIDIWDDKGEANAAHGDLESSHKDTVFTDAIQAWAATDPFERP